MGKLDDLKSSASTLMEAPAATLGFTRVHFESAKVFEAVDDEATDEGGLGLAGEHRLHPAIETQLVIPISRMSAARRAMLPIIARPRLS